MGALLSHTEILDTATVMLLINMPSYVTEVLLRAAGGGEGDATAVVNPQTSKDGPPHDNNQV